MPFYAAHRGEAISPSAVFSLSPVIRGESHEEINGRSAQGQAD